MVPGTPRIVVRQVTVRKYRKKNYAYYSVPVVLPVLNLATSTIASLLGNSSGCPFEDARLRHDHRSIGHGVDDHRAYEPRLSVLAQQR
eukprot:SAG11_NODE_11865_length_734_cov_1.085039_2_plen_88_part_00